MVIALIAFILPRVCISKKLVKNSTLSVGYSLGMVKMEAFDDSHFMHQAVRGGHTDHTGSIVSPMACIFDLKNKFLCNRKLMGYWPWYGENGSILRFSFYAPGC